MSGSINLFGGIGFGMGWAFAVGVGLAGAQLAWRIARADINSPQDCMGKFVSNKRFGAIVFGGIVTDRLFT